MCHNMWTGCLQALFWKPNKTLRFTYYCKLDHRAQGRWQSCHTVLHWEGVRTRWPFFGFKGKRKIDPGYGRCGAGGRCLFHPSSLSPEVFHWHFSKSNHAGPSAPNPTPRGTGWHLATVALLAPFLLSPETSMCCKAQLMCAQETKERESFIQVCVCSALSTFVASNWISAVWSVVSLLRPCLYFQTSALFYRFIIFAFGSAGAVLSFCWWKTQAFK